MCFPFSDMTGCGVRVAVVDSGIVPDHPRIGPIAGGVALSAGQAGTVEYGDNHFDCAGHGTACAGIIRRKASEAALYSVRILDESLSTEGCLLSAAIEWAVARGLDLVHMSLGTTDVEYRDELATACRNAADKGVILVAAEHNEGRESYPALLDDVIGVGAGNMRGMYDYHYRQSAVIECIARGDPQRVCWTEPPEILIGGTSVAAPHITALIALIRQAIPGASLKQVRDILQAHALPEGVKRSSSKPAISSGVLSDAGRLPASPGSAGRVEQTADGFSWIRKAAIYPFNKEMHALIRARDLIGFEIVGVADPVGKGLVGMDAGEAIGLCSSGIQIAPRLLSAVQGADTLILGYVDELGRIRNRDLLRECVHAALDHGVHVFSLLSLPHERYADLHEMAEAKGLRLHYPELSSSEAQRTLDEASAHPEVDVPVLAVAGTSSQQGKFTLQLALRRRLLDMGYRLGQVGTEHHAELFGMDFAFPMGYRASVRMPLDYYLPFLDAKMREICVEKQPHLILVGTQSGTVPYDIRERETQTLPTIAFLMGVKPDACVLVVNSVDADDYIQDTIDGIQALCHAPTLVLALPDQEKHIQQAYGRTAIKPRSMSEDKVSQKLRHLEETFSLPAICIANPTGIHVAADVIVKYFAEEEKDGCAT